MTDQLQHLCTRFRHLTRRLLVRLGVSRVLTFALGAMVLLILADFLWHFGVFGRTVALFAFLGGTAAAVALDLVRPLRERWSDQQVLDYLDRVLPGGHDRLVNVAELSDPSNVVEARWPEGRALVVRAVEELATGLDRVDLSHVIRPHAVRRWGVVAAGALLAAMTLGAIFQFATPYPYTSVGLRRLFLPWSPVRWPSSTWFDIETPTADARVPEGEDLPIRVRVHGRVPEQVTLVYQNVDDRARAASRDIEVTMFQAKATAEHTFQDLHDSVRFYVRGGDGRSDRVTVHVIKRPFIRDVTAYYRFPPYSGVPPKIVRSAHAAQLVGLEGTDVRVEFTASTPLKGAWIQLAGHAERVERPLSADGTRFDWTHQLAASTTYTVGLLDRFGNREKDAPTYTIQVQEDRPPAARLIAPVGDLDVSARARFRCEYRAEDDYGLNQVRLMVSLDGGPAKPLDEKVSGPVPQIGKVSAGGFDWDLERMDLAGVREVAYYLAAKDVNPTGRGAAESAHLRVSILSETEVQSQVLFASKALLTEALLGSNNQRWAYLDAIAWRRQRRSPPPAKTGTVPDEKTPRGQSPFSPAAAPPSAKRDVAIEQVLDEQAAAGRAATAMAARFKGLVEQMTLNRMQSAFFERRLEQAGTLIQQMAAERQPVMAAALKDAQPKDPAEDTPLGRAAKMDKALAGLERSQKLAALEFQRILHLLMDWNDLQNVLVKSRRLKELQQQVYDDSFVIAPLWVGREVEDLTESEAKRLETLGQQQEAIFEAERALEEELQSLALAAKAQGRAKVFAPLKENFELLRLRAVSDKIVQCAKAIKDNRVDVTLEDQHYVVRVFTFVAAKFEEAGREVPALAPPDLAAVIVDDREVEVAKVPAAGEPGSEALVFNPESSVDVEDVDAYKVNSIEQAMVFLQSIIDDQVLLYTRYTDEKFRERTRATRYRGLRLGMLGLRARRAVEASNKVLEFARRENRDSPLDGRGTVPVFPAEVLPYLQAVHTDLVELETLVSGGRTASPGQALARELSAAVQAGRRAIANRAKVIAQMDDRRRSNGRDEFGQPYRVVEPNLGTAVRMREALGWAVALQNDVNQKSQRLLAYAAAKPEPAGAGAPFDALNARAKALAAERQARVAELVTTTLADASGHIVGDELVQKLAREDLATLNAAAFTQAAAALKAGPISPALVETQTALLQSLDAAAHNLDERLDERIRPKEELATEVVAAHRAIEQVDLNASPEELARRIEAAREKALHDFKPEVIAERVKQSSLSPQARQYVLDALAQTADPKYQRLLSAYFSALVPPETNSEKKP